MTEYNFTTSLGPANSRLIVETITMAEYAGSYPFLHIARKYGLDYGAVLDIADYDRMAEFESGPLHGPSTPRRLAVALNLAVDFGMLTNNPHPALFEIVDAVTRQEAIRRGEIAPW